MAGRHVSPNRMELARLKRELQIARRGHRMLKDKRDGLMRHFLSIVYDTRDLRLQADELLVKAAGDMALAAAALQPEILGEALQSGHDRLRVEVSEENVMAVEVPHFGLPDYVEAALSVSDLPYGLATTGGEMDLAVRALREAFPVLLRLAEKEKTLQLLADEIERTRRRVNSLEHVLIPELEAGIREISMKMDENERGNLTRLMKVKETLVRQEILRRRAQQEEHGAAPERGGL